MQYKTLGPTDMRVSRVGFGCWAIGGHGWGRVDDAESVAAVRKALDLGINLFDTADVYGFGHSERLLSKALGAQRKDVLIATKFGVKWDQRGRIERDISPRRVTEALQGSLRRLQIDCIPLYQIHWPDDTTPIACTMEALMRRQEIGEIRWIGCCNFSSQLLRETMEIGPVVSMQAPYSVLNREIEGTILSACRELGTGVLVYSTLAQGVLSGKYGPNVKFDKEDVRSRSAYFQEPRYAESLEIVRRLDEIGDGYKKSAAQVAIQWVLGNPDVTCALAGIKGVDQVEENTKMDWTLAPEDRELIDRMVRPDGE